MPERQKHNLTAKQKRMLSDYHKRQQVAAQPFQHSGGAFDSIESLYTALKNSGETKDKARLMLMLRSWLTEVSSFDPVYGYVLDTGIVDFMDVVGKSMKLETLGSEAKDRIYRIVSHTKESVVNIMEQTRDKISREHAMVPIHAAREFDSHSVQWLSRQPGRTLRQKLSGKPHIKAVRRRTSVDTAENRLLKAFLLRLEQILIERQDALTLAEATEATEATEETCEEMLVSLQRWLRSEDAAEISAWGNSPPNNTVLQDKRYRKVWDGWLWLQEIDENIVGDYTRLQRDTLNLICWKVLSLLNNTGRFRTVQQPISIDYDNFSITPKIPVQGFLFPVSDSKIKGRIKNINHEKKFGFLTAECGQDLFFHKNNLSKKLDFNALKIGDSVTFIIGNNRQGKCADDVILATGIVPIAFELAGHKCDINVGEDKFSLQIGTDYVLLKKNEITENEFELNPEVLQEIPRKILSSITDFPSNDYIHESNKSGEKRVDSSIVDLSSIRPKFITHDGLQDYLPFRFLQQHWPLNSNSRTVIDCGYTKAIALDTDSEIISMRSLFSHNSEISDAAKSSASMSFAKMLSDHIRSDELTYIIPDCESEFKLESVRKSINFYFDKSTPIPKSIAAIFAWQSSKKFLQTRIHENDFILVIDIINGGISITPVQAVFNEELNSILPDTQGISWERHPTVIVENQSFHMRLVKNLDEDKCQESEKVYEFFGFDGLISDAGNISFVNGNDWYHLPTNIRDVLSKNLDSDILSSKIIDECLIDTKRYHGGSNVFIMPLNETLKKPDLRNKHNWLGPVWAPIKGCQTLNNWQKVVGDIALWRDHLPELSIRIVRDGHFDNFYLAKNATVIPQRGKPVNIPVEESFTLPAGQKHYSFPLLQGEGNKDLHFVAYLKSRAFPLREDTNCKLKLTYTYGADQPYELKFIPVDAMSADFKSLRVEWRPASDMTTPNNDCLPVPDFPIRKSWIDFKMYPNEDGSGVKDLLAWVEGDMNKILDVATYGRVQGPIPKWIDKGNGNIFCFIEDTFVHKSFLNLFNDQEFPQAGESLSFYKVRNDKGKYSGEDVTVDNFQPKYCFLSKSIRFPVLSIWNYGHSLAELDVPEHFRNSVFEGIKATCLILEEENITDTLREELLFFLSCLHKDAPSIIATRLFDFVKDRNNLRRYRRNIAFAIGDAELTWQKELLEHVVNPVDDQGLTRSITMEILSTAFWRSEGLINKFTENEIRLLNDNLFDCLEFDFQKIVNDAKAYQISVLCKHLELLLALLRTRGIEDESFKMIFSPDREMTKQYVILIDKISKKVIESGIELKSRISLQVEKPGIFFKTPDILYALRMYLTGDSGASVITISGISDDL